jgi:hypothetical protein
MFTGIDDIDWGSLEHARGSAENVPGWIRDLTDPDPEVHMAALEAVFDVLCYDDHVYDSTLAAMPYLIEVLTIPGLPARHGLASLLAGVTRRDRPEGAAANALALAAAPALVRLTADPDPGMRATIPKLLVALPVPDVADLLIGLVRREEDAEVRRALLDALNGLHLDNDTIDRMLEAAATERASTAIALLSAVAQQEPGRVPLDGLAGLLERAYTEQSRSDRSVEGLTGPLGPLVDERVAIITPLLASPHAGLARDALLAADRLIDRWRGDYREIVQLAATLLDHPDQDLTRWAERLLARWYPVSAPALEPMAQLLDRLDAQPPLDEQPAWAITAALDDGDLRPCLMMSAASGDERALPHLLATLRWPVRPALHWPVRPRKGILLFSAFPQHAERILAEVAEHAPELLHETRRAFGKGADEEVERLLATRPSYEWAYQLGQLGPAAAAAIPALRTAATGRRAGAAVGAAGALWRIDRSPDALELLTAHLNASGPIAALQEIGAMGPEAAAVAPLVAAHLNAPPEGHWLRSAHAALALWRLTGETDRVATVLAAAWQGNPHNRMMIAEAATGDLATALAPLFRSELASVHRHNIPGIDWGRCAIDEDERLLELCRSALSHAG